MNAILGAEIVIPVDATVEVGVIVEDIVGAVGNKQTEGDDQERDP